MRDALQIDLNEAKSTLKGYKEKLLQLRRAL